MPIAPAPAPDGPRSSSLTEPLSDRELALLAFERQWWRYAAAKEQAVLEQFGLSTTQYYQQLNALIDRPAALAAEPMLVKRLRRQRAARQADRAARRVGG